MSRPGISSGVQRPKVVAWCTIVMGGTGGTLVSTVPYNYLIFVNKSCKFKLSINSKETNEMQWNLIIFLKVLYTVQGQCEERIHHRLDARTLQATRHIHIHAFIHFIVIVGGAREENLEELIWGVTRALDLSRNAAVLNYSLCYCP